MTPKELEGRATITIEEAASLLGISRGVAYEEARRYELTNGQEGIPVVRLGRRMLVPVPKIKALLGAAAG